MPNIEPILPQHFDALSTIYAQGIQSGIATFQTELPTWEQWDKAHMQVARVGAFINNALVGWCALAPVSSRPVYSGVAELSIYVHTHFHRMGIGTALMHHVINTSQHHNIWTLQSSIFPENIGSLQLHLQCGFREVGCREKIACRNGTWHNNLLLERRSSIIGL